MVYCGWGQQRFHYRIKDYFGENPSFEYEDVIPETMRAVPVLFAKDHRDMLFKLYLMMHKQYIPISKEQRSYYITSNCSSI